MEDVEDEVEVGGDGERQVEDGVVEAQPKKSVEGLEEEIPPLLPVHW